MEIVMSWSCSTDGVTSNTCRSWGLRRIMWRIIPKWILGKGFEWLRLNWLVLPCLTGEYTVGPFKLCCFTVTRISWARYVKPVQLKPVWGCSWLKVLQQLEKITAHAQTGVPLAHRSV